MQFAGSDIGRIALGVLVLIALGYVVAGALLYIWQDRLVYVPNRQIEATPADIGLDFKEVSFAASDGVRVAGWYLPLPDPRGTVLFCHGNAGNISHLLEVAQDAQALGLEVLLFDYRGYGRSEGEPTEQGTYQDAEAAWNYLVEEEGVDPERIIVVGRSLGGPIAAWLARAKSPAALFLEATFSTLPDLARELYPLFPIGLLARYQYPTLEYLIEIHCPVLVSHSRDDRLISISHGKRLYAAARGPKAFIELRGDHVAAFREQAEVYGAGVESFLTQKLGW